MLYPCVFSRANSIKARFFSTELRQIKRIFIHCIKPSPQGAKIIFRPLLNLFSIKYKTVATEIQRATSSNRFKNKARLDRKSVV